MAADRMRTMRCPLAGVALCAIAGILLADVWKVDPWWFVAATVAVTPWLKWRWPVFAFVVVAFGAVHSWNVQRDGAVLLAKVVPESGAIYLQGEAVVRDSPVATGAAGAWQFPAHLRTMTIAGERHGVDARVLMNWKGSPPAYGDLVKFHGTLVNTSVPRNPGQFDARAFYKRQGIHSRILVRNALDGQVIGSGYGYKLRSVAIRARARMEEWLRLDLEDAEAEAEVITSVVLGAGNSLEESTKTKFRNTGTLHLFAVSGLHVGMVALLLYLVLRLLPVRRARLIWFIVPLLIFYALVTGLRPSVVRATVMTVLVMGGLLIDRRASLINNLAAAALLLLAWDTNQLFTSGFQLSFAVVTSIILLAGPVSRWLLRFAKPDDFIPEKLWNGWEHASDWTGRHVGQLAAVALAAWIGSVPLMLYNFNLITPFGVVVNMIAVPLAFVVLSLGLLAVMTAPVTAGLAMIFNNSNWLTIKVLLAVIDFFAALPGVAVRVATEKPEGDVIAEVRVFEAGTGGAIAIQSGSTHWLIDAGNDRFARTAIAPALWRRGVNKLDGLLLTHGDARHIGGAEFLVEEFYPRRILQTPLADRSSVRRALAGHFSEWNIGTEHARLHQIIRLGNGAELRVLHPVPGMERRLADDKALVLMLEAGGTKILMLSDSGLSTTRWLEEEFPDLTCDVVVRGRHSRDFIAHPGFVEKLDARIVVTEAIDMMSRSGTSREVPFDENVKHFRQEDSGAVIIRIFPDGYEVEAYVTGEVLTNRAR